MITLNIRKQFYILLELIFKKHENLLKLVNSFKKKKLNFINLAPIQKYSSVIFTPQFVNTDSIGRSSHKKQNKKIILDMDSLSSTKFVQDSQSGFESKAERLLDIEQTLNTIMQQNIKKPKNLGIEEFDSELLSFKEISEIEHEDRRSNRIRKQKPPQSVTNLPTQHNDNWQGKFKIQNLFKQILGLIQGGTRITRLRITPRNSTFLPLSNNSKKKNATMEILNELEIKSDVQLQKTLQRTTMKTFIYETVY